MHPPRKRSPNRTAALKLLARSSGFAGDNSTRRSAAICLFRRRRQLSRLSGANNNANIIAQGWHGPSPEHDAVPVVASQLKSTQQPNNDLHREIRCLQQNPVHLLSCSEGDGGIKRLHREQNGISKNGCHHRNPDRGDYGMNEEQHYVKRYLLGTSMRGHVASISYKHFSTDISRRLHSKTPAA